MPVPRAGRRQKLAAQGRAGACGGGAGQIILSDVWKLETSSRIIVLIGVAVILMAVSFAYQQFRASKRNPPEEEK